MEITNQITKRFCKDLKIPINIFQEPYFEYFVDLYDEHYKVREKLGWLKDVLKDCKTQEDFFGMSEKISRNIKETIKNTSAYNAFNSFDSQKQFLTKEKIPQQNIYIVPNIGKNLISVDLEKANFNCLNLFGLKDELKVDSYNEFMRRFTEYDYFLNSKTIRQVIFGDLNPSRQQKVQKYIIDNLCTELLGAGCKLSSASSDEIIISSEISVKEVKDILKNVPQEFKFFRVESFSFNRIGTENDYFIKTTIQENNEPKLEFKSVPGHFHAQIFKKYYGLEINENDLLFHHEGFMAQFKEPLFAPELTNKIKMKM
jgi:hypothetical protein